MYCNAALRFHFGVRCTQDGIILTGRISHQRQYMAVRTLRGLHGRSLRRDRTLFSIQLRLEKYRAKNVNALMYGAGHGGFEAVVVVGLTMINNIVWSFMIRSGRIAELTESLSGDQLTLTQQSIGLLIETPSYQFLLGGIERLFSIFLQISLSVLVWFSVKWEGKLYLYPAAILIHFAIDATAALLSGLHVNLFIIEAVIAVFTAAVALFARRLWRETM